MYFQFQAKEPEHWVFFQKLEHCQVRKGEKVATFQQELLLTTTIELLLYRPASAAISKRAVLTNMLYIVRFFTHF